MLTFGDLDKNSFNVCGEWICDRLKGKVLETISTEKSLESFIAKGAEKWGSG